MFSLTIHVTHSLKLKDDIADELSVTKA